MKRPFSFILIALLLANFAAAQTSPASRPISAVIQRQEKRPDGSRLSVYSWTVHSAAPAQPALKHHLVPRRSEQTAGNAAALYDVAAMMTHNDQPTTRPDPSGKGTLDLPDDYLKLPLSELPLADTESLLQQHRPKLEHLDFAATRDACHWDWAIREQGFGAHLPQLGVLRPVNKWLCLRTRVHILNGRYDDAVASLRSGFTLARNIERDGALINMLVGAGIATSNLDVARELSAAPDGPNLYWALADLPHPLFRVADSMELERLGVMWIFRNLRRDAPMGQADLDSVVADIGVTMTWTESTQSRMMIGVAAAGAYTTAKQYLIDHGMSEAQVSSLPALQVSLLYFQGTFETTFDGLVKWSRAPFWQGYLPMKAAVEAASEPTAVINPLDSLIANVHQAWATVTHVDRCLAAQQVVEAIRAYAAANGGKAPSSLDELKDPPAPLDPSTNKPFSYEAQGDRFVLSATNTIDRHDLRYEVTLAKGAP